MTEFVLSLVWVGWGVVCFLSGAWLLGPSIYHRQLTNAVNRYTDRRAISADEMQRRIVGTLRGDDVG